MSLARLGRVGDDLGRAPTVAQVNKDQATVVPAAIDPPRQSDGLTRVFSSQFSTIVCL
jgi:hypothetical protein